MQCRLLLSQCILEVGDMVEDMSDLIQFMVL